MERRRARNSSSPAAARPTSAFCRRETSWI